MPQDPIVKISETSNLPQDNYQIGVDTAFTAAETQSLADLQNSPGFSVLLRALLSEVKIYELALGDFTKSSEVTQNIINRWLVARQFYHAVKQWPVRAAGELSQLRDAEIEQSFSQGPRLSLVPPKNLQ